MCGICGVRRFGPEPITKEQITALLVANQNRGNHATGVAIQNPDEPIHVLKMNEPAWNFVSSDIYDAFMKEHLREDTYCVLGHTRAATQGTPKDNNNNHPLYTEHTAVVHNGIVNNDDELFRDGKLQRNGQVDSDIFRAILDKHGLTREGINAIRKVRGSAAIAAISNDAPGKLLLARSGNPIVLATTKDGNQMVWSSEKNAIHYAMRPFVLRRGVWMQPNRTDLAWSTMRNDSAWIFDQDGLEWHDEWQINWNFTPKTYEVNKTYNNHRNRFYTDGKKDVVQCRNPKCKKWLVLKPEHRSKALWLLNCGECKQALASPPQSDKELVDAT